MTNSPLYDALMAQAKLINSLPPRPSAILASHSVPYGRLYRQWNTRGQLVVWVNRGELADALGPRKATPTNYPWQGIPILTDKKEQ